MTKYIFDFDDVLFHNTRLFKEHIYTCLQKAGVARNIAEKYYKETRQSEFSLKNFISVLLAREKIFGTTMEAVYENIMSECPNFVNKELVKTVGKLGKDNCYMVTNGEKQFQQEKLEKSRVAPLFSKIYIVPGSKKEIIYKICDENKNEKVIFIEDKVKFIEDIDLNKCPNLKTILFDEQGLVKLQAQLGT